MIVFTICSNNYLPMARVWGESMFRYNPNVTVIIGLVDLPDPAIDYRALGPFEFLPLRDIGIPDLEGMILRYSIVELNTAVKPFYFSYLFQRLVAIEDTHAKVCYFDPDIQIFSSLESIERSLDVANVLLTPHLLSPVKPDGGTVGEHTFLNYGIYNLGFCGMRWGGTTGRVLEWWSERMVELCKAQVEKGMFVDQLWMNHAPIFFDGIEVSRNPCLNVAYWNLHERHLQRREGVWYVNDLAPLQFYHFSSFQFNEPDSLGRYSTRYSLKNRPEMRPLFEEYRVQLLEYEYVRFRKIPCAYVQLRAEWVVRQKGEFYKKHPFRLLVDYRNRPFRLLQALVRAAVPKRVKHCTDSAR